MVTTCLSSFFYLEVTINSRQLNQDLDRHSSTFKNKQKYTQTNVVHLCITARNKTEEVSKWHAESMKRQKGIISITS